MFTASKEELDYYHQKVNIQVVWRVVERLNIKDYGKLENFKEIPEILGIGGKVLAGHHQKGKFWQSSATSLLKISCKHFIEKHMSLNFVNSSTIFCPKFCFSFQGDLFKVVSRSQYVSNLESCEVVSKRKIIDL